MRVQVENGRVYSVPTTWSRNAIKVFVTKYCRSHEGQFKETSISEVFQRLVKFWSGKKDVQEQLFTDLWGQVASPNSPQYFNAGIYKRHKVKGNKIGLWYQQPIGYGEEFTEELPSESTYEYPQLHACFIQPVEDNLISILGLLTKEALLFSRGSGTGTNFSKLRAKGERISSGGSSCGVLTFLEAYDRLAICIKSGGTTRRAAKMVILDIDHPEIEQFILWKVGEEKKARILAKEGYGTDWQSESYRTVSGQNSNNSIAVPDAFIDTLVHDGDWRLTGRVDRSVDRTVKATNLWNIICQAAWDCADPGLQFSDTINDWNTTPHRGKIRASNPCSEHLRLDDSACNLASINLCKFIDEDEFLIDQFMACVGRWVAVLDKSVDLAGYPSQQIAHNAGQYRDIGLGYCNLGSLLMRYGVGYGTDEGRMIAALITALMAGAAHVASANRAAGFGKYFAYESQYHLAIVEKHRREANRLAEEKTRTPLINQLQKAANLIWEEAQAKAERNGLRNAQLTVIAPTGTIGITMDCETTGIEPLYSIKTTKQLAGGGELTFISESVKRQLKRLGVDSVADVRPQDRGVFATAVAPDGGHILSPEAHVDMVAAVQPFICGGISKTVNLPNSATIRDISNIYRRAHEAEVKCISVYRDGCKSQPLSPMECRTCGDEGCEI